ncbi:hypothetical protein AVEN_116708-1 [Araneus ventricosus]|uniref:Uncharacterized protein n=1 Tax=Araneus ventricosus TaxID=182803 RepID=A0A4Y2EL11_ARAVE|nr:hypothetical protein AVEN_116708-1 [Araneus ventricosus]
MEGRTHGRRPSTHTEGRTHGRKTQKEGHMEGRHRRKTWKEDTEGRTHGRREGTDYMIAAHEHPSPSQTTDCSGVDTPSTKILFEKDIRMLPEH